MSGLATWARSDWSSDPAWLPKGRKIGERQAVSETKEIAMTSDHKATVSGTYIAAGNVRSEQISHLRNAELNLAQLLLAKRAFLQLGSPLPNALDRFDMDRHTYEQAMIVLLETLDDAIGRAEASIAKLRPVVERLLAAESALNEARIGAMKI